MTLQKPQISNKGRANQLNKLSFKSLHNYLLLFGLLFSFSGVANAYSTPVISTTCCGMGINGVTINSDNGLPRLRSAFWVSGPNFLPSLIPGYSGAASTPRYSDYTQYQDPSPTADPNGIPILFKDYSYTISVNYAGDYPGKIKAWIDFDNDGVFNNDASEEITFPNTNNGAGIIQQTSNSFTVPANAATATPRIRIGEDYLYTSDPTPEYSQYGEFEDYLIDIQPTPPPSEPSAPANLLATVANNQIDLAWDAAVPNGSPVTDYIIAYRDPPTTGVYQIFNDGVSTTTSTSVTGLTNGTIYEFSVSAVNGVGTGPESTTTQTPNLVYGTPVISNPGFGMGINDVFITSDGGVLPKLQSSLWTTGPNFLPSIIPSYNGASTPRYSDYTSYQDPSPTEEPKGIPIFLKESSYTISVNYAGTYPGRTKAWIDFNHDGVFNNDPSEEITFPNTNEGSGIIQQNSNSFTVPANAATTTTRIRVGEDYFFSGDPTPLASTYGEFEDYLVNIQSSGPPTEPSAPTNLTATPANSQINLSWTAASANGSPVTDYIIAYRDPPTTGVYQIFNEAISSATSTSVTGLTNGTLYEFSVSAVNIIGTGPESTTTGTPNLSYSTPIIDSSCCGMGINDVTISSDGGVVPKLESSLWTTGPSFLPSLIPGYLGAAVSPQYSNYTSYQDPSSTANPKGIPVLYKGNSYTISVKYAGAFAGRVKAWIDFNYDGVFNDDSSEEITFPNTTNSSGIIQQTSNSFTVPANAATATPRIRIGEDYSSNPNPTPEHSQYGEFEDYLVDLQIAPPPAVVSIADSTFTGSPLTVLANGEHAILTATTNDSSAQPIANKLVTASQISGSITAELYAVDCSNSYIYTDTVAPIEATTNINGQACFIGISSIPGTAVFQAVDSSDSNLALPQTVEITYNEIPSDANISTFTASPLQVVNNGTAYTNLTIHLYDSLSNPLVGKTVNIGHDGTDLTGTPVLCPSTDATVAGTSDSTGQICYHFSSNTRQIVTFNATGTNDNVLLTATPIVEFGLRFSNPTTSTVELRNPYIEPIDSANYDFNKYSGYNAAYLKITLRDNIDGTLQPNKQVYITPATNYNFITHQVDCDNPVQTILANDQTDSFGRACFLIYSDQALEFGSSSTTFTIAVDEASDPDTILDTHPTIYIASLANLNTFNFRFRNDNANEVGTNPIEDTNIPHYNLNPDDNFRIRMNMSRVNNFNVFPGSNQYLALNNLAEHEDELSPMTTTDIGPRPLPVYDMDTGALNFRAYQAMAVDTDLNNITESIYTASANHTGSSIRIYKYNSNNISQAPTFFDIDPCAPGETCSTGISGNVTNMFIDPDRATNTMYLVLSPTPRSMGGKIKVIKINLATGTAINVLTKLNGSSFTPFSTDAEVDFQKGFMYLSVSGQYDGPGGSSAHVMKIKLGGYLEDTSIVSELKLTNTSAPITASVIDTTNQFLYLTLQDPNHVTGSKLIKIDINVGETLPPVKVDEINLFSNLDQGEVQEVGLQSAVIDTVNGYAYFGSSVDPSASSYIYTPKAYITKVDIDPNRDFETVARLKTSAIPNIASDTLNGAELFNFDSFDEVGTTAQIDITNQYAYFIAAHQNEYIGFPVYKIYRVDLTDFTHDNEYDELNYPSPNNQSIKGNLFAPALGRGFIIRNHTDGDQLTEYSAATRTNFKIQSSPNIDSEYCNQTNQSSYSWTSLPNSDFTITDSSFINSSGPPYETTSNLAGVLDDNNETFVNGEIRDNGTATETIQLGRKNFTEIEYNLKATNTAKGSYCFRFIDADSTDTNQTGGNNNYISGREPINYSATTTNYWAPLTINGVILSKSSTNVIEATTTDTYGVKLATQPSANVTVNILADDNRMVLTPDTTPASPTATSLTFSTSNWDTYQYITTTAPATTAIEGTTSSIIHHTTTSSDPAYNNIFVRPVSSAVTDFGATTSNVIANVSGGISLTTPGNFSFPSVSGNSDLPNFSPSLNLSINESRGSTADYTVTLQATPFCKSPGKCIPLDKIFVTTSDLTNSFSSLNAAQIGEFLANYLQAGESLADRVAYVNTNSADDRVLNDTSAVTLIDTRAVPSGDGSNPLQGILSFAIHLMIDYANIPTLSSGTYTTTLTIDLNPTP